MYQSERTTAILPSLAAKTIGFRPNVWLRRGLRALALRHRARRDIIRLMERPHLARDVGLSADQLWHEFIRMDGGV